MKSRKIGEATIGDMRAAVWMAAVLAASALLVRASLGATADEPYQFIISGSPVANVSYSAVSAGTVLTTATVKAESSASSLEARFRTWLESIGTALKSTRFRGFFIDIK